MSIANENSKSKLTFSNAVSLRGRVCHLIGLLQLDSSIGEHVLEVRWLFRTGQGWEWFVEIVFLALHWRFWAVCCHGRTTGLAIASDTQAELFVPRKSTALSKSWSTDC